MERSVIARAALGNHILKKIVNNNILKTKPFFSLLLFGLSAIGEKDNLLKAEEYFDFLFLKVIIKIK